MTGIVSGYSQPDPFKKRPVHTGYGAMTVLLDNIKCCVIMKIEIVN